MNVFTAPWPGPGNSEGPAEAEGWFEATFPTPEEPELHDRLEATLVVVSSWPGPGDSDGPVGT